MGKDTAIARAFGRGDWRKVIELETASLNEEEHKQFSYAMIGMAYENLSEYDNAKQNYAKALEHDQVCEQALEGLSRIYYNEKDYNLTYHYVLKGLHSVKETNYSVPKFIKIMIAIIIKIIRPRRPFKEILNEAYDMDQTRNKWIKWATEFKEWYEENIDDGNKNKLH
jgi:tetratricopeptide (TPR) repeat protein